MPKDGPSAGVAIAAALMSLFRDKAIHQNLAMTGEVTLTGRVLPVGGVREKVLAARRAGITTVLIPRHNEKDLIELPAEVKADVTFHSVDTLDDVVPHLFPDISRRSLPSRPPRPRSSPAPAPSPTTAAAEAGEGVIRREATHGHPPCDTHNFQGGAGPRRARKPPGRRAALASRRSASSPSHVPMALVPGRNVGGA